MTQFIIRISSATDRVFMQTVSEISYSTMELDLIQADMMQAALQKAIAEAKSFVPGEKPFVEWEL